MDHCFSVATQSSCRGLSYSKSGTASWELGTDGSSLTKPLNTSTKCGQRYMFLNTTAPNPCISDNSEAMAVTTVGFLTSLPQMCSWSSLQELSPNRCGGNKGRTAGLHQCSSQDVVVPGHKEVGGLSKQHLQERSSCPALTFHSGHLSKSGRSRDFCQSGTLLG